VHLLFLEIDQKNNAPWRCYLARGIVGSQVPGFGGENNRASQLRHSAGVSPVFLVIPSCVKLHNMLL
jgi:hypothetical protein